MITRGGMTAERLITATERGTELAIEARVVHADAVHQHLLDLVPAKDAKGFWNAVDVPAADPRTANPG